MTSSFTQKQPESGFVPLTLTLSVKCRFKSSFLRLPPKYVLLRPCRKLRPIWRFYRSNICRCCTSDQSDVVVELQQLLQKTPIYLVGMMGSGKSTIGQSLATKLSYSFLDTDQVIEQVEQRKITEIFEQDGEEKFRDMESSVLHRIQPCLGCVVSTGGGIVLRSSNWTVLRSGIVVFLDVSVSTIMKRLLNDTSRPLLQGAEPQKRLEQIRNTRLPLYTKADIHIRLNDSYMEEQLTLEQWIDWITTRLVEFLTTQQYRSPRNLS
ncbi:hypothetical protein GpartN1_g6307.t1 [Galdieria partita]|uniref:shikimate kinase n=1 Tax=Galdieria partita TaxID=83374 RepID=A0A9C7USY2_9RHOD|nr:hypothetical protein GpartN1_g6307.t1 [Galdieria partita]